MVPLDNANKRREEKGLTIAQLNGQIRKIDELTFAVKSQSGNGEYQVIKSELGYICSCPDSMYRGQTCKHAYGVAISIEIAKKVKQNVVTIQPVTISDCLFCHSAKLKKSGVRHNQNYDIQRYACLDCKKTFSINIGFEKRKHNPQAITAAMQLYFSGESLRNTMRSLKLLGVEVSHQTVWNWIEKYCTLMQDYVEKLRPEMSDTWRADELYMKIGGDLKYVFALLDDQTRYWIAQEVADTKHKHDAKGLFKKGKELAGKRPMKIITDGLRSYHNAYKTEFFTLANPRTVHEVSVMTEDRHDNNKMERLNGEIRGREKVMRGLKVKNTPFLPAFRYSIVR
jgi:transposase-like protein